MATGDMSLNVSLPPMRIRNEWLLIARLTVSCRIRVMDTVLNTNNLMNGSSSFTTRIIVGSNTERHSTRTRQWYNARSRFRDTRTMPYAYWGSECQSERAPALGENAFWSRLLDCGRETEVSRWTDKTSQSLRKWSLLKDKSCHLARKEWSFYSAGKFFKEIAILQRNFSILNNISRTTKVNLHTEEQRSREIPKVVEDKLTKFNENRTVV